MLDQLVVVKLNGALAGNLGCSGATSTIPVRNNLTSLDLTVQQIEHLNRTYSADVPLVLMNSFLTHEETVRTVRKYSGCGVRIQCFQQSCYPRLSRDTLLPTARAGWVEGEQSEHWHPPGHGDFYQSFARSGLLEQFQSQGRQFCFISNMDNIGARVDLRILQLCLTHQQEFLMEVTDKTRADVKGGTLIQYEGRLRLLEVAQVQLVLTFCILFADGR